MKLNTKIIALIAIGAAYLLNKRTTSSLRKELEEIRNQSMIDDDILRNEMEERTEDPNTAIKKNISITPKLDFGNMSGRAWCVRMIWVINNLSTKYTYTITGIKSVVTIDGYTCKVWAPGNQTTPLTLSPGKSVEIWSEKDNIILYDAESVRKEIYKKYHKQYDYQSGLNTITNIRVQSSYGGTEVVSYVDLAGTIRQKKGVGYWGLTDKYGQDGENMINKDL